MVIPRHCSIAEVVVLVYNHVRDNSNILYFTFQISALIYVLSDITVCAGRTHMTR